MKVTIDSTEPLADALRVIGALYNVRLDVDPADGADVTRDSTVSPAPRDQSSRRSSRKSRGRAAKSASNRASRKPPAVSVADIRRWAQSNGHAVSNRGTLPTSVKAAYADAHSA